MFNMRALGYRAHTETVFHFLPNSNKYIGIDCYQGLSYPSFRSSTELFIVYKLSYAGVTRQTVVEDI